MSIYDQLNDEAVSIRDTEDLDDYDALMAVVARRNMALVKDGDQCRVYRLPDGQLVNLWIDATEPGIQAGGLGFDDQYDD